MCEFIIDGAEITDRKSLHETFANGLDFPQWYGENLDALYDCLTDITHETALTVTNFPALEQTLGRYSSALRTTLEEAAKNNDRLTLQII